MNTPKRVVYISDTAYHSLQTMANTRFIMKYITHLDLSPNAWKDTRPAYLQAEDEARLSSPSIHFPQWHTEAPRYPRTLAIDEHVLAQLVALSFRFTITNHLRSDGNANTLSRAGLVLEAIGLKWLTQINPPTLLPSVSDEVRRLRLSNKRRLEAASLPLV